MDHMELKTSDPEIDLESGENTSEDDMVRLSNGTSAKIILGRSWSGLFGLDKSSQCTKGAEHYRNVSGSCNNLAVKCENGMLNMEQELVRKMVKEKRKKMGHKKLAKPPRPPKGPALDAADIKMVREFSELAALKRKRVERMNTLRKMKAEKRSTTSNGNLFAMLITIIFCFVIISQGLLGSRA